MGVLATGCRRSTVPLAPWHIDDSEARARNIRDAEPRGHPATIPTTQTVTAQMLSQEEVASDFISAG
jgi:hypothetical protein